MAREQPADVSFRQFAADPGPVTRGLLQRRTYILTLNGQPLASIVPVRQGQAVPAEEVMAIFATAPAIDADEMQADRDRNISQEIRDPYEGTGR